MVILAAFFVLAHAAEFAVILFSFFFITALIVAFK
jgi:hypothetical protein